MFKYSQISTLNQQNSQLYPQKISNLSTIITALSTEFQHQEYKTSKIYTINIFNKFAQTFLLLQNITNLSTHFNPFSTQFPHNFHIFSTPFPLFQLLYSSPISTFYKSNSFKPSQTQSKIHIVNSSCFTYNIAINKWRCSQLERFSAKSDKLSKIMT